MKNLFLILIIFINIITFSSKTANAVGECSKYGVMAYYDGFSSCKCISGYSFGKDFLGNTSCVSNSEICHSEYGYNSTEDYGGGCKCNYGYGLSKNSIGETKCVSLDSMCHDQLGYSSSYDNLSDSCKCSYGYVINNNKCVYGNSYCTSKFGMYSSYDSSSKQCTCDTGYTLNNDGQCVQKQNNVYFVLKELDTDNRKAFIKSEYDYSYYLIQYNYGCYASSFKRYLNKQIVINLGTDFSLDTWDKIVLQDDNETCDITHKEKVGSDFSLYTKVQDEDISNYTYNNTESSYKTQNESNIVLEKKVTEIKKKVVDNKEIATSSINKKDIINPEPVKKNKWYQKVFNWFKKR